MSKDISDYPDGMTSDRPMEEPSHRHHDNDNDQNSIMPLQILEKDSSGRITARYIETPHQSKQPLSPDDKSPKNLVPQKTRLDIIKNLPSNDQTIPFFGLITDSLKNAFLPTGYPHTTSPDYTSYQIYDSLQAFSSSIAGLLSSRAVLSGIGVGDSNASPTAALLLSVLQDSIGRFATILFAHRFGTALEPECKMWRLAADVFNDAAMVLDGLSPVFPAGIMRGGVLACSASLRALCGVAAGSAKASLSNHFAINQNLGEVSAKDSSQETVISLTGMLAGTVVVRWATGPVETWILLIALLACHLGCNYLAVRSVEMDCLNRQRGTLVFWALRGEKGERPKGTATTMTTITPTLRSIARRERIFEKDGILRSEDGDAIGWARVGVSLATMAAYMGCKRTPTGAITDFQNDMSMSKLFRLYEKEDFLLWFDRSSSTALIVLKEGCRPRSLVKAWWLALMMADKHKKSPVVISQKKLELRGEKQGLLPDSNWTLLSSTYGELMGENGVVDEWMRKLEEVGWDLDVPAIETISGTRVSLASVD